MITRPTRKLRTMLGSLAAVVAIGGILAACGLGGGSGLSDCINDVPGPDAWNTGAPASYDLPVVSCSNNGGLVSDEDQYLYPEATSDLTLTCTVEEDGEGAGVYLYVFRDPGTGAEGDLFPDMPVECSEGGTEVDVDLEDDLDPGDHILIEVYHDGPGSRARVTVD